MKPAPTMPTRIGRSAASRAFSALSTMIIVLLLRSSASGAHLVLQLGLDLVEQLPRRVLRGRLGDRQRPRQPEAGVVVAEAAFRVGRVELTDLVARLSRVLEH